MQTTQPVQLSQETRFGTPPFVQRCQALGITLLTIDCEGRILSAQSRNSGAMDPDVVGSALFAGSLRRLAPIWAGREAPEPVALWPGCWALPIPVQRRRQRAGYYVAVLVTREMVETEQIQVICEAAGIDLRAARSRVEAHLPPGAAAVDQWAAMLRWMHGDLASLDQQTHEVDDLTRQLGEVYEELSLVYKLSARMSVTHDPLSFLQEALTELQQVLGLRWAALRLSDDELRLHGLRGRTLIAGHCPCDLDDLGRLGAGLVTDCETSGAAQIQQVCALGIPGLGPANGTILLVPVSRDKQRLAIFFGGQKTDGTALSSVDSKLATAAAQNMAIFIENAMLYDDMEDMFMGTLHALVSSIDAKDSYTFGHSERVAWLSREIARAAGLDTRTVERVYLSALVHDVGKIGVPESVLTKAGRLTPAEFAMVKAHPELGVKIVERIPQMRDLIPGVLHHHEKYNGGGYPYGLSGVDIPLFGRIICLADSFDAMSSSRTYRSAMPVEEVFQELARCSGSQFDPELAHAFMKNVDLARYYAMLADHQDHRSPLNQVMRLTA